MIATMVLSEELGRSTFGGFAITAWFTPTWHRRTWPTRVPKRRKPSIYRELSQANLSRRSALLEPDAGSDAAGIRTRATKTDGG